MRTWQVLPAHEQDALPQLLAVPDMVDVLRLT
jgi:hypothetical protein